MFFNYFKGGHSKKYATTTQRINKNKLNTNKIQSNTSKTTRKKMGGKNVDTIRNTGCKKKHKRKENTY